MQQSDFYVILIVILLFNLYCWLLLSCAGLSWRLCWSTCSGLNCGRRTPFCSLNPEKLTSLLQIGRSVCCDLHRQMDGLSVSCSFLRDVMRPDTLAVWCGGFPLWNINCIVRPAGLHLAVCTDPAAQQGAWFSLKAGGDGTDPAALHSNIVSEPCSNCGLQS